MATLDMATLDMATLDMATLDMVTRDMATLDTAALAEGARNLLQGCAGLRAGQRLALIHEDPALGWYDAAAPEAVAAMARTLGARIDAVAVGAPADGLSPAAATAAAEADITIFFARAGDRDRFRPAEDDQVAIVSYARTAAALASPYGTRPHDAMRVRRDRIDRILLGARRIEVACPLGTALVGAPPPDGPPPEDVAIRRFPMCIGVPIPAGPFEGTVALSGYLTPTGSRPCEPANLALASVVMADIADGRILGFRGDPADVARVRAHYDRIARTFGIDGASVHSFHAGIHEGCAFDGAAADDPDLWSNSVFGNPRYLHFHTCGAAAPGEICWMVERPTIACDGRVLWDDGRLTVG